MLRKLQVATHRLLAKRTDNLSADQDSIPATASLLGLPPEISNQIYEYLAQQTTLVLPPCKLRKQPPPPNLLLVCRQTHQAFKPLLLANASIIAQIGGYNFDFLVKVLESFSTKDREALALNKGLRVQLLLAHVPSREERLSLRKWCDRRDALRSSSHTRGNPLFRYQSHCLSRVRPPRPISRYMDRGHMEVDLILAHIRSLKAMQALADEAEGGVSMLELERIVEDLQVCVDGYERLHRLESREAGSG
ncbi:hypothetical protein B0A50_07740 [Salinomyces thailandicus]|uniref:F-box domain-containing protein n=1 Tax=Salinomyces thailandicus TaxID=706561 RepID=A0A4U0TLN6_9PEZI|nr:hypothetical protein B0A50_07740 [Salinomyces thailandica]